MKDPVLTTELEAALVRALRAAWHDLNHSHFERRLRPPAFALSEGVSRLGVWLLGARTIELSRPLVLERGWGTVVEVLKHEMAHQYAHEVLGATDESAHGPAFRGVCERLGIDARAAGLPGNGAGQLPSEHDARVLGRIAKLLALAESSNVHEAESAMAEAQRLMLKHNLEVAPALGYGFRHLGEPTGRVSEHQRVLAQILDDHFFVEVIWVPVWRSLEGKRGSVLEVCGAPANLEMAAYVHAFLMQTAERLWQGYQRARKLRTRRDRRTFLAGVMTGFREKLETQRERHQSEGLIWVGDGDLAAFYRQRHPHVRWTRHFGNRRTDAHTHGREAGRGIVLSRPVTGAAARGHLLGGRS